MGNINLLAIDLAKNIFQLHGVDKQGNCVLKQRLTRDKLVEVISTLPSCRIVMEACGSANYWTRVFKRLGHEVDLISPQYVKPFVKGNKTDRNDSEAIAEAASRPSMRYVEPKTIEQQDIQCLLRIREQLIAERIALSNQTRGFLAEYGITINQGVAAFRQRIPIILENKQNELTDLMRHHVQRLYNRFCALETEIHVYDKAIQSACKLSESAQKIMQIDGVGPMIAASILSLGDLKRFKNGRHFSAFLGLVPREKSSGNKQIRLGMSRRGDSYVRQLLMHGARSVLIRVNKKDTAQSQWLKNLVARKGVNKATGALANKIARHIWAVITQEGCYDRNKGYGNAKAITIAA